MIAGVTGTLAEKNRDGIVVQTESGVAYAVVVPLGVFERLPASGARVSLYTELVVREDGWTLFGFDSPLERMVFHRLLTASGFGPRLAIALLSALGPVRTVSSIRDRDLAALSTVSGIGRKKAERLVLELQDRFTDLLLDSAPADQGGAGAAAVRALEALGYGAPVAEAVVRHVVDESPDADTSDLVRRALQVIAQGGNR